MSVASKVKELFHNEGIHHNGAFTSSMDRVVKKSSKPKPKKKPGSTKKSGLGSKIKKMFKKGK